ncbi:MAG: hypothetical protein E6G67_12505 [Actinobacteria bacterium]|nr:MAG: hypothetical protein E6G67_12505 [Actinomycetota bacterium]
MPRDAHKPRSLWSGSITFGLVNAPVRIYSAIAEHKLHFNFLHVKDDSPIGYEKVCKKEGKPVPDDEIVKAFEYAKGKYVYMEDEDFEAARVRGYKTIERRTTSGRRRAQNASTRCSRVRWTSPGSPRLRSS